MFVPISDHKFSFVFFSARRPITGEFLGGCKRENTVNIRDHVSAACCIVIRRNFHKVLFGSLVDLQLISEMSLSSSSLIQCDNILTTTLTSTITFCSGQLDRINSNFSLFSKKCYFVDHQLQILSKYVEHLGIFV